MENNLEDIKTDEMQEESSKRTKRLLLIGVASAVLLVALIIVITFLTKKEAPKNPEFNIAELEKLGDIGGEGKQEGEKDEEFDRLIRELKSKQTPVQEVVQPQEEVQAVQEITKEEEVKVPAETVHSSQEVTVQKQEQKESVALPQPKQEKKQEQKAVSLPKAEEPKKQSKPSASEAFGGIDDVLPRGVYLQVGVFAGTPNAEFLEKIKKYTYKIQKKQKEGKVLTHYLIGPYPDRTKADALKSEIISSQIAKNPTVVEIR